MSPRITSHADRRQEIAEATWLVIERNGHARAGLREIAREMNASTGVISHYFRDKEELLAFSLARVVDRQLERLGAAAREHGLRAALAELLPLDTERRRECVIWLVLTTESLHQPDLAAELDRRCGEALEAITNALGEALPATSQTPVSAVAQEVQTLIDGIGLCALGSPARYPPAHQVSLLDQALDRLGI